MLVEEVMHRSSVTIHAEKAVTFAARKMQQYQLGFLPVVAGGKLCGVVTDRDLLLRCVAEGHNPLTTPVREVMTPHVTFVRPHQELTDAARLMEEESIFRLPVVEPFGVVGFVSAPEVLQHLPSSFFLPLHQLPLP